MESSIYSLSFFSVEFGSARHLKLSKSGNTVFYKKHWDTLINARDVGGQSALNSGGRVIQRKKCAKKIESDVRLRTERRPESSEARAISSF